MSELVLDASAVVHLLTERETWSAEEAMAQFALLAPAHLDAEVLSSLARLYRAGLLTDTKVSQALTHLASLPIERLPITHPQLLSAWALRHNVAARDALYLALANDLGTKVVTGDQRLRRAAPELTVGPDELAAG